MTFSDAEEDQPNKKHNIQNGNEVMNNDEEVNDEEIEAEVSPSTSDCSNQSTEACALPQQATASASCNGTKDNEKPLQQTDSDSSEDLDSEKVMLKLQQIQGYINQTSNAMKAIEKEGNLNKLEQYNTLAKVMKDLEASRENLVARLIQLKAKSTELITDAKHEPGNSQRVGVIGSMNEVVDPLSMQERLARHETEQGVLSSRLRESVARRQELVARYKNTRERLNNLKKQRQGLVIEERSLLQSQGAPEDPYEESSIPDADTWTIEQLQQAVQDFRGLKNKVIHLRSLYETQARSVDVNDEEAQANVVSKKEKIDLKQTQVEAILSQLKELLEKKGGHLPPEDVDGNGEGSEVVFGTQNSVEFSDAMAVGEALHTSTDDVLASSDIAAKQEHLKKLKSQLNNMKMILDETQNIRKANIADLESRKEDSLAEKKDDLLQSIEESNDIDVLTYNGKCITLSREQMDDPTIFDKSQQLRQAKEQLAKMEEVMAMIVIASDQKKPLNEVLTPEYMAILEDAQNELESPLEKNDQNGRQLEPIDLSEHHQSATVSASATPYAENGQKSAAMELKIDRDNPEISDHVSSDLISNSKVKDSSKNHNANIWNYAARNGAMEAFDEPSVPDLRGMQLELCQKKNTLEALLNKMGKSSGFLTDNADNVSVNISGANSEADEVLQPGNDVPQTQSIINRNPLTEQLPKELTANHGPPLKEMTQKNRNRLDSSKENGKPETMIQLPPIANIFNRSQGVRPKIHVCDKKDQVPNVSWETSANKNTTMDNSEDVHKMMSSAIAQLKRLQQTINQLSDSIHTNKPSSTDEGMGYSALPPSRPPIPMYPNYMPQPNLQGGMCGGPYNFNYDPQNNEMNSEGRMMDAIQQCLSQLNVHRMEIQALSKQLQPIVDERENYEKNRDDLMPSGSFRSRQQNVPFTKYRPKEPQPSGMRGHGQTSTNRPVNSYCQSRRVSFPRANNFDDLDFGNQNFYPPFDGCVSPDSDNLLDRQIDQSRTMQDSDAAYNSMQPPQSSNSILNNKVLPGTRANNYWDNFRSYSHQNPLSSTRKSNSRGDNFSGLVHPNTINNSRVKEPIKAYPNRLHENRRQNVTSLRNDHVNRTSEKNSSLGVKRGHSRGNSHPTAIVPEQQYPIVKQAKHENHREERFFQPTARDAGYLPSFPPSNEDVGTFEEYRRKEKIRQESRSEVIKQAESLLQREHPQFLLKLFRYLSKITDHTDQRVALELLKELSNRDSNFYNQWVSNLSSHNNEEYQPTLEPNRMQINKNKATSLEKPEGISFSSNSELDINEAFQWFEDDFQIKEPFDAFKNLTAVDGDPVIGRRQVPENIGSSSTSSSVSSFYSPMESSSQWKTSKDHVNFFDTSRRVEDKSPERPVIGGLEQLSNITEVNNLTTETSQNAIRKEAKSLVTASVMNQNEPSQYNKKQLIKELPIKKQQAVNKESLKSRSIIFNLIIASVMTKILDYIKVMLVSNISSDRLLERLHLSILNIIEEHSSNHSSSIFSASFENKLRRFLHCFHGKRIIEIQKDLPSAISQFLIHQFYSHFYQENTGENWSQAYQVQINGQSNLHRQQTRDSQNVIAGTGGGDVIDKHYVKPLDELSYRCRKPDQCGQNRSDTSRMPQRCKANSKLNRTNNRNHFDLLPFENSSRFQQVRLLDSPVGDEPEGSFAQPSNQRNNAQWNNIMISCQNSEPNLMSEITTVPVHYLAEADQIRDKPETEEEDGKDAFGFVGLPFERFDFAVGFSNSNRQNVPGQGLDEVPTKLRSPLPIAGYDYEGELFETFEELSYRQPKKQAGVDVLPCPKFSIHPTEKSP